MAYTSVSAAFWPMYGALQQAYRGAGLKIQSERGAHQSGFSGEKTHLLARADLSVQGQALDYFD